MATSIFSPLSLPTKKHLDSKTAFSGSYDLVLNQHHFGGIGMNWIIELAFCWTEIEIETSKNIPVHSWSKLIFFEKWTNKLIKP